MPHLLVVLFLTLWTGCAVSPGQNFTVTVEEAETELRALRRDPQRLPRPVVVLDGFLDPGFGSASWSRDLHAVADDPQVLRVSYPHARSLAECAAEAIRRIHERFPDQPVDVVGISMGGAVAFYVAADPTIRVERIFTVCSPLRGASRANQPTWIALQRDLRPDSVGMTRLRNLINDFHGVRVHYGGWGDRTVLVSEAAPPGETPYWLPADGPAAFGHVGATRDPRLRLDLLRRLRGEPPVTVEHPVPLPESSPVPTTRPAG